MANLFALALVILTLLTGISFALEKWIWPKKKNSCPLWSVTPRNSGRAAVERERKIVPFPWWVESSASLFPFILSVLVIRSFIYEPFQIPSGSMMPTLLVGDFILVEKFAYGLKDPLLHRQIRDTAEPKRGDVVVFRFPSNPSLNYIKRVVGLPGDIVRYSGKKVICIRAEGEPLFTPAIQSNSQKQLSNFEGDPTSIIHKREKLGTVEHGILIDTNRKDHIELYQPRSRMNEWAVPKNHYFVMGDNRDNSADSRYWGFVPKENLVGKAVAIWISFIMDREESSWLPSWVPTGVRFGRVGGIE